MVYFIQLIHTHSLTLTPSHTHTLTHSQGDNYEEEVINYHKAKAGYTPARAETEFCDAARKLHRYGYHLFGVQVYRVNVIFNVIFLYIIIGL